MVTTAWSDEAGRRYLDLLKKTLADSVYADKRVGRRLTHSFGRSLRDRVRNLAVKACGRFGLYLVRDIDPESQMEGMEWPSVALTMIGMKRLDNLQECVERVIHDCVPGDLFEAGVWRGGACILMRAVLKVHGEADRTVWAADSFVGLPPPSLSVPEDTGDIHHTEDFLKISLAEVKAAFGKFDLLDDQVRFLEGWFDETLTSAPVKRIAVLRIDADMYKSTMDALSGLYDKVSEGGFVIIDDYLALAPCREAVNNFRKARGITDEVIPIDRAGVYWRRT